MDTEKGISQGAPRPFDLTDEAERARLLREVHGYMLVSRHHGTDHSGRAHAIEALRVLVSDEWNLVPSKKVNP